MAPDKSPKLISHVLAPIDARARHARSETKYASAQKIEPSSDDGLCDDVGDLVFGRNLTEGNSPTRHPPADHGVFGS